ncbi:MAG: MipA/OmpV family protein [Gammaproteobacteria bacterium]|nr:MipA/OmpV family protein [Gammaproteobacteria bacterium]
MTQNNYREKRIFRWFLAIKLSCIASVPIHVSAAHLPLWQLGLGAGVLNAPHYRGSTTVEPLYIPVPYLIYRGEQLRVDRDGIRSKLFDSDRIKLDLSLGGNLPVPKSEKSARVNMPRLDPLGEIGPALSFTLWKNKDRNSTLLFKIPFRAVFSVGEPLIAHQGWVISPYINFNVKMRKSNALWRYGVSVGPIFADAKYHNYFYQVNSIFKTNIRDEYHADMGYSGSRIIMTAAKNTNTYFFGVFARYDNLSGAAFEDSPLVETNNYWIAGIAFAWIFASSDNGASH